jgi:hypothetical protein
MQAIASATSSASGQVAIAKVLAEAISTGGLATAASEAIAEAYGKNPAGVAIALGDALAISNSDSAKTGVAASSLAEVRVVVLVKVVAQA